MVVLRPGALADQKGSGDWCGVRSVVVLRPGASAAQKGSGGWCGV